MTTLEQIKGFLLPELEKINSEQQHIRERLTGIEQHLLVSRTYAANCQE